MRRSEGLSVLTIDCRSFGGQAGASARIENYLGFPTGISGMALMGRAFSQAQKFGVEIAIPDEAVKLECGNDPCHLLLGTGERIQARSVVIATGARYRRLDVDRLDEFEGASVHYWASPLEADLCAGQDVALVGGGNSRRPGDRLPRQPGAPCDRSSRGGRLSATMSQYLIERIESLPNVEVVDRLRDQPAGTGRMAALESVCRARPLVGNRNQAPRALPLLLHRRGAEHRLAAELRPQARRARVRLTGGPDDRLPLETSRRGIFAVGDVRSGSVKRVAASVGDGAQVVAAIHQYLATPAEPPVVIEQQIQVTAAE